MLWKWSFKFFGTQYQFLTRVTPARETFHYGVGNRCHDGRYVLFLDYDDTPYDWIIEEIKLLQTMTQLGTAYLFKTRKGHHVIFLEKFYLGNIVEMLRMTTCDYQYQNVPLFYGKKLWVLRSSNKKHEELKYLGCVPNPNDALYLRERSLAHKNYLIVKYAVPPEDFLRGGRFDDFEELSLAYYYIHEK